MLRVGFYGLGLILALAAATAPAVELLSPDDFTKLCVEKIKAAVPAAAIEVPAPLRLNLRHPRSGDSSIYLEQAYETYKLAPDKVDEVIGKYVSGAREVMLSGTKIDAARIVPVVRERAWLAAMGAVPGDGDDAAVVFDELNEELVIVFAEDALNSLSFFSPADLQKAEIPRKGLRQLAAQNLVRMLPKIERRGEDGFYVVSAGGDYDSSLLAIGTVWTKESFEVNGDFVFAVPSRATLYVTGSKDAEGIKKMRDYARTAYRDSPQKLSPKLFVLRDNVLVVFPE